MKQILERILSNNFFKVAMIMLFVTVMVLGCFAFDVWFVHFMKDTFGINVYWTF